MFTSYNLTLITLVVATISMVMSATALWPHFKHGLAFVRDAVLWTALVFVIMAVATLAWRSYRTSQSDPELQEVSAQDGAYGWPAENGYNYEKDDWRSR